MFSPTELSKIDTDYFKVLSKGAFAVTLQSKCTGHCWHIIHQEYPGFSSCEVHHTHNYGTPYHLHGSARDLTIAQRKIKQHDDYQLHYRRKSKHK